MIKILVVEDDASLNSLVTFYLKQAGYFVTSCKNGGEALEALERESYSLILTDIMMPEIDGFSLAQSVRLTDKNTPIIFMSARDDKPSKLLGYKIGVDDYITKPFDVDELILKINAILRRLKIESEKKVTVGNLTMLLDERTAYIDGKEVPFTVREFNILFKLVSYPKKTFTRSALMEEFWDFDSSATSRTVDVYMAKLREKTASCNGFEIATVHGLGYKVVLK